VNGESKVDLNKVKQITGFEVWKMGEEDQGGDKGR